MNRNIVTEHDVAAWRVQSEIATEQHSGPERKPRIVLGGEVITQPVAVDSWYARLAKAIPAEALSLYLALDRAVEPPDGKYDASTVALLAIALIVSLVFNVVYLKVIWKVRPSQIAASTFALIAYVYSIGGVFHALNLTTTRTQMFVLIVTAALLSLFKPIEPVKTEAPTS